MEPPPQSLCHFKVCFNKCKTEFWKTDVCVYIWKPFFLLVAVWSGWHRPSLSPWKYFWPSPREVPDDGLPCYHIASRSQGSNCFSFYWETKNIAFVIFLRRRINRHPPACFEVLMLGAWQLLGSPHCGVSLAHGARWLRTDQKLLVVLLKPALTSFLKAYSLRSRSKCVLVCWQQLPLLNSRPYFFPFTFLFYYEKFQTHRKIKKFMLSLELYNWYLAWMASLHTYSSSHICLSMNTSCCFQTSL